MTWGRPADYLLAYKNANASEWRRHLMWLEERGYPHLDALRKELARANRKGHSNAAAVSTAKPGREDGSPNGD